MENERFGAALSRLEFLIKARFLPFGEELRLALGEAATHGETRLGQIQGVFVLSFAGHGRARW